MDIEKRLLEIWNSKYLTALPLWIKERGFNYAVNKNQKDILITGMNPSFRVGAEEGNSNFDFNFIASQDKYDRYWTSLKKMLFDIEQNINLLNNTAYLDIFYFRETNQKYLNTHLLKTKRVYNSQLIKLI